MCGNTTVPHHQKSGEEKLLKRSTMGMYDTILAQNPHINLLSARKTSNKGIIFIKTSKSQEYSMAILNYSQYITNSMELNTS
jgi:hypothetical protein